MKTYSKTDTGKCRSTNQDYILVSEKPLGNLKNLFVVADGMGGHNAGDFASKYTAESLAEFICAEKEKDPARILETAIGKANRKLLNKAKENIQLQGMGTTLVVATIANEILYVANVGDSRLYLIGSEITQVTTDHSLVEEMVRLGEITREQARNHPDKNLITRAIGVGEEVIVDIFRKKLNQDNIILMCTDGLTNMVEDQEIRDIVSSSGTLSQGGAQLIETANANGGKDNIGIILIEPFSDEVRL